MVGGEAEVLERCRPILAAMGQTITHCGPSGAGQTVKLCNQVAIAGALLGVCEALALAQKSGVDPERMLAAIQRGRSGIVAALEPGPADRGARLRAGLMIRLMQKDLRLALDAADDVLQPLPNTALVHQLYYQLQAQGGRRRWDAGAGAGRRGAGRHDDRRLSCPPHRGNSCRLSRAG